MRFSFNSEFPCHFPNSVILNRLEQIQLKLRRMNGLLLLNSPSKQNAWNGLVWSGSTRTRKREALGFNANLQTAKRNNMNKKTKLYKISCVDIWWCIASQCGINVSVLYFILLIIIVCLRYCVVRCTVEHTHRTSSHKAVIIIVFGRDVIATARNRSSTITQIGSVEYDKYFKTHKITKTSVKRTR